MTKIDKSHSKQDLLDIANTLDLHITIAHGERKKDIQEKFYNYFQDLDNISYQDNVYNIKDKIGLIHYLISKTPKKILNVKDKKVVMCICKNIIGYCNNKYWLPYNKYKTSQEIHDDMLFIIQFGDLPSVRRCCRLMNQNVMNTFTYEPIISAEVKKDIQEKIEMKTTNRYICKIRRGPITLYFD